MPPCFREVRADVDRDAAEVEDQLGVDRVGVVLAVIAGGRAGVVAPVVGQRRARLGHDAAERGDGSSADLAQVAGELVDLGGVAAEKAHETTRSTS
jgi:hypothetical protein